MPQIPEVSLFLRRLWRLSLVIAGVLALGTVGFVITEDASVWHGFVWALDTVATVGSIPAPDDASASGRQGRADRAGRRYALLRARHRRRSSSSPATSADLLAERRARRDDRLAVRPLHHLRLRPRRPPGGPGPAGGGRPLRRRRRQRPENREVAAGRPGVRFIAGQPAEDEVLRAGGHRARPRGRRLRGLRRREHLHHADRARAARRHRDRRPRQCRGRRAASSSGRAPTGSSRRTRRAAPRWRASPCTRRSRAWSTWRRSTGWRRSRSTAGCAGEGKTIGDVRGGVLHRRAAPGRRRLPGPAAGRDDARAPATSSWRMGTLRTMDRLEALFAPTAAAGEPVTTPVGELRAARASGPRPRCATAGAMAPAGRAPTLERPKKAEFGDYSTNAAMLLAPVLGEPAARHRGPPGRRAGRRWGRSGPRRGGGPRLPEPLPGRCLVPRGARPRARGGRRVRWRGCAGSPAHQRRVRVRQPDGPAHRGRRAPRRLRRLARPGPRVRRPRGRARVLLQRRGQPDPQARGVDPRSRAGRAGPGGRLRGRVRGRAGGGAPRRGRRRSRRAGPRRDSAAHGWHPGVPRALPRGLRRLVLRAHPARGRRRARSTTPSPSCASAGTSTTSEGALWLRTTDLRRRQGPRAGALDRRVHLLRRRRRLPRSTSASGGTTGCSTSSAPTTTATSRVSRRWWPPSAAIPETYEIIIMQFVHIVEAEERASMSKRARRLRDARRAARRHRRRRHALLHAPALARHDDGPRPRPRARGEQREPGLLRPVRPRPHRRDPGQGGGGGGDAPSADVRAGCIRPSARWSQAARLPGGGRGGGGAPRAPPDRHLRARAGAGVHRLLPRLQGRRGRAARGRERSGWPCA